MNRQIQAAFRALLIGFSLMTVLFIFSDFDSAEMLALSANVTHQSSDGSPQRPEADQTVSPTHDRTDNAIPASGSMRFASQSTVKQRAMVPSTDIEPSAPPRRDKAQGRPKRQVRRPPTDPPSPPEQVADSQVPEAPCTQPARPTSPMVKLGPILDAEETPAPNRSHVPLTAKLAKQPVLFQTVPTPELKVQDTNLAIEGRLISMQRQLAQLAETQQSQQTEGLERAAQMLQQTQQSTLLQNLEQQLQRLVPAVQQPANTPQPPAPQQDAVPPPAATVEAPATAETSQTTAKQPKDRVLEAKPTDDDPESFDFQFQNVEINEALGMLGQLAGLNILVGKDVTGKVPAANFQSVGVEEALHAILKSLGYVFERDGDFIFVMTAVEQEARAKAETQAGRKVITKVYRPNYISAKEMQSLITPLLSEGIGQIAVTTPNEIGIAPNAESAGGDQLAQEDAFVVVDYEDVIADVDQILAELDVPPMQVVIEAVILSVALDDELKFGVNFALLGASSQGLAVFGNGSTLNTANALPGTTTPFLPAGSAFAADTAGLKWGFLRGDVGLFIEAIEKIADTNLVAAPQLRVINKQRAELLIGQQLSYSTITQNGQTSIENINFLDVGTKLLLRPFVSPDGLVRLEIHPETSTGEVKENKYPETETTQVTTNVMVRDGTTVVIGGLIKEQVEESYNRLPLLGALPVVGHAFRNKIEKISREELIILITPRIVREPEAAAEGDVTRFESEDRADHFRDHLAPINRRNLARMERERAEHYFERCEYEKARQHVNRALRYSKNDLQALRIRDQIDAVQGQQRHRLLNWPFLSRHSELPESNDSLSVQEADLDEFGSPPSVPPLPENAPQ